jgi:hypothetical protein
MIGKGNQQMAKTIKLALRALLTLADRIVGIVWPGLRAILKRRDVFVIGLVGVAAGVIASTAIHEHFRKESPKPAKTKLPPTPPQMVKPHLSWAEQQCERAIDEHVKSVDTFFADSKKNTRGFAEEALGWGSKLRLIADYVPYTKGGRHETFIREKFEEHIFKPQQLENVVKQVVDSYMAHVRSIEGTMLVDMRLDASDFPTSQLFARLDQPRLREQYEAALSRAIEKTGKSLSADVGTELISLIAGEVLTQVAIQMGVSATILGSGATSAWLTLGVGFVVGVIVDQIVSRVWDWYADPTGNLAAVLNEKLDKINHLIVDGSDNAQGLRERLRQFARERAVLRGQAVLSLLQSQ